MSHDLVLLSGNANRALAGRIASYLDLKLGNAIVERFSDGETRVELNENIRGRDVFIIQPTCAPANQHIMEALVMVDACRRASAKRITLVNPYFGYARQERKSAPRTPITAKLVSDLFTVAGVDRMLCMELHTSAIQGFFNIPVDHLFSKPVFGPYFQGRDNLLVVSPDAGGAERARAIAKYYDCGLAIVDKRRDRPNESAVMHIIGDVTDKDCLIVDDICDTGGSLCKAAQALVDKGARSVSAAITHPVLSGPAVERIAESCLTELVVTDTIPLSEKARNCSKIKQLSVGELLGKAIRRIHGAGSISSLFV
ncbi:ribose-phosphate pyrophosphokinase [Pseudobacteriovorax antillogorgiicola]|uniref:Ribose-phosphate pyrophosphokinase n=1 Tax=Pseudobacteriovorax antillogorgiicola TaxID=1513793 RepID=A0A1Y6BA75_9BACT|nr:ribose-phosphate pyrophosphokinase [Pseudobacteriovorax antillogorgiicola]TCS59280.1 ribose-phosphate pyrophosphokinase [Pseudobacteriovorax antillogorgiicola]SME89803.1 ribose-phosphate pyrophosphokinase [Pseudobacteriovorax antillogorgiicola]